jgi:tetratricopeptide (TPR) repeat protein
MIESPSDETVQDENHNQSGMASADKYEAGLALRKAGLYKPAIEEFEQAATDGTYALKAYAQIGLCHKSRGHHEEAVTAFRKALKSPHSSMKEIVQILYVLGRTLETLGRIDETLEAYRWIRREDPGYRDVEHRILGLSTRRTSTTRYASSSRQSWVGSVIRSCQHLLRMSK